MAHDRLSSGFSLSAPRPSTRLALKVVLISLLLAPCALAGEVQSGESGNPPEEDTKAAPVSGQPPTSVPAAIEPFFQRLDAFGRDRVKTAKFVELTFDRGAQTGWLVAEDDTSVTTLMDDLLPWVYLKNEPTILPSSWHPDTVRLKSTREVGFAEFCKALVERKSDKDDVRLRLHGPGPSIHLLVAHAAWKRGLTDQVEPIIAAHPAYTGEMAAFGAAAFEDLAWLHYLRGVNLLMYADRRDVIPHLRLATQVAPESEHAKASSELLQQLERIIASKTGTTNAVSQPKQGEAATVAAYIEQLVDLKCPQVSQPGSIYPYVVIDGDQPSEDTPSTHLRQLGYAAVPALMAALNDDRPTRTVYHWRDFHDSRLVWRVSDFAWHILCDISGREFGYQRIVGFTFSMMEPEEKQAAKDEIGRWYNETKDLSPDDRMMTFFSSNRFEDWVTAAEYFAKKSDTRPVTTLLPRLETVGSFQQGELCEVIAKFKDRSAVPPITKVMNAAEEPSDRIRAAIALWELGDTSGVPVAISFVEAESPAYGSWDTPVWFLMHSKTDEAIAALRRVLLHAKPDRAAETLEFIRGGIIGYSHGDAQRALVGSVEIAEVLVAAMDRESETGHVFNGETQRIKDLAAKAFFELRNENDPQFRGHVFRIDGSIFNPSMDQSSRDQQIEEMKRWYERNKERLDWDVERNCLVIRGIRPAHDGRNIAVNQEQPPYASDFDMVAGDAYTFELPNEKTVAVWCVRDEGIAEQTTASGLKTRWGEQPFVRPKIRWKNHEDGGRVSDGWESYIESGGVSTSTRSKTSEYVLYVDGWKFSIIEDLAAEDRLPVKIRIVAR